MAIWRIKGARGESFRQGSRGHRFGRGGGGNRTAERSTSARVFYDLSGDRWGWWMILFGLHFDIYDVVLCIFALIPRL